ncbi:MAG TPA: SigB/SigF/SigG family RNA polymerase sigma factor [Acidimicrobiales bacterium]|nr:SigB/SigF/SigG family RNA polymerase sigma factor [Acidimicrobiales bacterium]
MAAKKASGYGSMNAESVTAEPGTTERPDGTLRRFSDFAASRDDSIRDELIEAHIGLARHLARRFVDRGEPYDDLVQVASLALVKAVDRFDPDRGTSFATFATRTILGEIKRHFRDKAWAVRAPRRIQDLYVALRGSIALLSQELGRSPTIAELAKDMGVNEEEAIEALEAGQGYRTTSLEAPNRQGEGAPLSEFLGVDEDGFTEAERRLELSPILEALPARARTILQLRFEEGLTQSEIASRIGVSQMHVSRLIRVSLGKLRDEYST